MPQRTLGRCALIPLSIITLGLASASQAQDDQLTRRFIETPKTSGAPAQRHTTSALWKPEKTAVIVCDVWDYHHSINAVRRLDEMLPRMEALLTAARNRGSIIIHAPSDCMPFYADHPARRRAEQVEKGKLPAEIASWCSKIDAEHSARYPVDQSDGGEDDDPAEHAAWAARLKELGRNPAMPWKAQSPKLTIDSQRDYISDRGDEVWSILQQRRIEHVLMIGVHTNMCVLGRPFGLRQLARNGVDVLLVRDLTDCMYNPQRWPYVDHFTGNDLVIAYVEQYLCPTITSDQILGGEPLRFQHDQRPERDLAPEKLAALLNRDPPWKRVDWTEKKVAAAAASPEKPLYLRCALRFAGESLDSPATLLVSGPVEQAWLNGEPLTRTKASATVAAFLVKKENTFGNDDANVLVLQFCGDSRQAAEFPAPKVVTRSGATLLTGGWQCFAGEGDAPTGLPLPAKFGLSPEVLHTAR